jgi:hypothetical protein
MPIWQKRLHKALLQLQGIDLHLPTCFETTPLDTVHGFGLPIEARMLEEAFPTPCNPGDVEYAFPLGAVGPPGRFPNRMDWVSVASGSEIPPSEASGVSFPPPPSTISVPRAARREHTLSSSTNHNYQPANLRRSGFVQSSRHRTNPVIPRPMGQHLSTQDTALAYMRAAALADKQFAICVEKLQSKKGVSYRALHAAATFEERCWLSWIWKSTGPIQVPILLLGDTTTKMATIGNTLTREDFHLKKTTLETGLLSAFGREKPLCKDYFRSINACKEFLACAKESPLSGDAQDLVSGWLDGLGDFYSPNIKQILPQVHAHLCSHVDWYEKEVVWQLGAKRWAGFFKALRPCLSRT